MTRTYGSRTPVSEPSSSSATASGRRWSSCCTSVPPPRLRSRRHPQRRRAGEPRVAARSPSRRTSLSCRAHTSSRSPSWRSAGITAYPRRASGAGTGSALDFGLPPARCLASARLAMPGRTHHAEPGEPRCPAPGCSRPAGFATEHDGEGLCLRHASHRSAASPTRTPGTSPRRLRAALSPGGSLAAA